VAVSIREMNADIQLTVGQARALIETLETVVAIVEGIKSG
jgi:hypothetical protein